LEIGEIAINLADKTIYSKDARGDIITLGHGQQARAGSLITPADAAPMNPKTGDMWIDTTSSNFDKYVWYDDGSSQQWIKI
jgi:hypothetical protein